MGVFDSIVTQGGQSPAPDIATSGGLSLGYLNEPPPSDVIQKKPAAQPASKGVFDDVVTQKPKPEAPGAIDTLGRSAANAMTFGLADRGAALGEALTGIGGEFGEYSRNLAKEQELTKAANSEHPAAAILGTLGGAVANPIGAEVAAPTVAGRIGQGIATGAAQGAAYGAGSSPDLTNIPEVAKNTAEGALTGGAIGGVAVPAVEAAAPIAKFVANATGIPQTVKALFDPQGAATKLIGEALERDKANRAKIIQRRADVGETPAETEINRLGLTPQEHGTAADNGLPVNVADVGGEATRRLARTAANISPEARDILQSETAARFEGQQPRIADRLTQLGGGNSSQTLDKLRERAATANRPKYKQAYEEGAKGVWTPELERLSAAPAVQTAIKDATKTGRNYDVAHGFEPTKNPFVEGEDGRMSLHAGDNGEMPIPALQFWDHVKRNLDDTIDTALRAGKKNEADSLTTLKRNIVSELDKAVPSYAAARSSAAKFFGAGDALEAGEKFVTAKGENHEFAKAIKSFTPSERELFAHGFMSEIERKINEAGSNRNTLINGVFSSPAARQRIEMAIGPARARQLETHLHVEAVMDQLRNAVTGNSTTAQQLKDIVTHGGALGSALHLGGIVRAFIAHGAKGLDERVMQHVAEGLTSRDPSVYERAMRTVQASSALSKAFKTGASDLIMKEILAEMAREREGKNQKAK